MNELTTLWDAEEVAQYADTDFAVAEPTLPEPAAAAKEPRPSLEQQLRMGPVLLGIYCFGGAMFFGLSAMAVDTVIQLVK